MKSRGGPITGGMSILAQSRKYVELMCPYDDSAMIFGESAQWTGNISHLFSQEVLMNCTADDLEILSGCCGLAHLCCKDDGPVLQAMLEAKNKLSQVWEQLVFFVIDPPFFGEDEPEEFVAHTRNPMELQCGPCQTTESAYLHIFYTGVGPLLVSVLDNEETRKRVLYSDEVVILLKDKLNEIASTVEQLLIPLCKEHDRKIHPSPQLSNDEFAEEIYSFCYHCIAILEKEEKIPRTKMCSYCFACNPTLACAKCRNAFCKYYSHSRSSIVVLLYTILI